MSKEVILKYLTEFNAWVKGQEVYVMFNNGGHRLVDSLEDFNEDVKYIVLKDSYFFYRTALAEGKIVQYLGQYSNMWHEVQEPNFNLHPNCYRIKPDEPKFKVGDFVRYVHSTPAKALEINNINGNRYYFTNSEMSCLEYELELWTPVKGEWCWFWDKCTPHRPTLRQYDIFPEGYSEENMFHDSEQNPFDFCEPFLNSRPSYLKDK